jgi:hypothetical protein
MSPAQSSTHVSALDAIFANPPFGSAGFLLEALAGEDEALQVLQVDEPEVEPTPEPALSGLDFIHAEFDRLRALPFAESSDGSDTRPPVRARDVVLSARIRRRAQHLSRCSGSQWPDQNRITITTAPDATRAEVSETLLHELVHAATDIPIHVMTGRRLIHYFYFRRALIEAAEAAYGLALPAGAARWPCGQVDCAIVRALEALGGEWDLPVGA